MISFKEKYADSTIGAFPRQDISPKKKMTDEWMLLQCEAMYKAYITGATRISYDDVAKIKENRNYSRGQQDTAKYRAQFLGDSENSEVEFIRKGLMNIDYSPPKILPKHLNVVKNMFSDINYEMLINAIDEKATKEKSTAKWRTWVKSQLRPQLEEMNMVMQMPVIDIPDGLPESIEDLEFQESIGAFRLSKELAFEAAVQEVKDRCKMQTLLSAVIEDLFVFGRAVVRDYTNPVTQKVEWRHCPIERTIVAYNSKDIYDPEFAGEIKTYTLAQLIERTGMSEDEAMEIAQTYHGAGYLSGQDFLQYDVDDENDNYRQKQWKMFNVHVVEWEFENIDIVRHEIVKNKYGNINVYDKTNTEKKVKGEVGEYPEKMRYRCSWIIGTEKVFDYGYQYDIPRATPQEAGSSFHIADVGIPFVDIVKTNIDQATMAFFRIQNTIANATESGVILDYDSFDNVVMSNKKLKPAELVKMGKLSGVWITKKKGFEGQLNMSANKPVEFFEGGAGRQLEENINIYRFNIMAIEEQLGMPPIATAGRQERESTLGEQQLMFASSTNAVKHFLYATKELVTCLATNTILRIQLIAKHSDKGYQAISNTLGYENAQILKITKDEALTEMGVEILPVFNSSSKEAIHQAALASMQIGKSGGVGIRLSDYMKVKRFLEAGLIRKAEQWLLYSEDKELKRQIQMQRENMELNKQTQLEHEQAKQKGKMQELAVKGQQEKELSAQEAEQQIVNSTIDKAMEAPEKATYQAE